MFRFIWANEDIYEGGWSMNNRHGKGEEEHEDGSKEIGHWVKNEKQGQFQCYDQSGTLTHSKIYKNNEEIKCEQVK